MEGLDDILRGGFPQNCLHLITGAPGTGKTTLAMRFLLEGVKRGGRCLYITLSESKQELEKVARSHGWVLSRLHLKELIPSDRAERLASAGLTRRIDGDRRAKHPWRPTVSWSSFLDSGHSSQKRDPGLYAVKPIG